MLSRSLVFSQLQSTSNAGYAAQIQSLFNRLKVSDDTKRQQTQLLAYLNHAIQPYFIDKICFYLFGSSEHGLGHNWSDWDVLFEAYNMVYQMPIYRQTSLAQICALMNSYHGRKNAVQSLRQTSIHYEEFEQLNPLSQKILLKTLIETHGPEFGLTGIQMSYDAYNPKPIIRGIYHRRPVEIILNKRLGKFKSDFIGALANCDPSGNIKMLLLSIRVWGDLHTLYGYPQYHEHGTTFKSYHLTILTLAYLQSMNFFGPTKPDADDEPLFVEGVNVRFKIRLNKTFSANELPVYIRRFLQFMVDRLTTNVFYVRTALITPKDKAGGMFIQDPLQNVNICADVSDKYVQMIKIKALLSLAAMKTDMLNFSSILNISYPRQTSINLQNGPNVFIKFRAMPLFQTIIEAFNHLMVQTLGFTTIFADRQDDPQGMITFVRRYIATSLVSPPGFVLTVQNPPVDIYLIIKLDRTNLEIWIDCLGLSSASYGQFIAVVESYLKSKFANML